VAQSKLLALPQEMAFVTLDGGGFVISSQKLPVLTEPAKFMVTVWPDADQASKGPASMGRPGNGLGWNKRWKALIPTQIFPGPEAHGVCPADKVDQADHRPSTCSRPAPGTTIRALIFIDRHLPDLP